MPVGAISLDDPSSPDVVALLERHLAFAREHSPPEDVHALDVDALKVPSISFYSLRVDGVLLGVGAIKVLGRDHAELKSMHTALEARGRGVGRTMLEHLLGIARAKGIRRVSLETGTMEAFAPARSLYASVGFEPCPPFGPYVESPNSVCMSLVLAPPGEAPVGSAPDQHEVEPS